MVLNAFSPTTTLAEEYSLCYQQPRYWLGDLRASQTCLTEHARISEHSRKLITDHGQGLQEDCVPHAQCGSPTPLESRSGCLQNNSKSECNDEANKAWCIRLGMSASTSLTIRQSYIGLTFGGHEAAATMRRRGQRPWRMQA